MRLHLEGFLQADDVAVLHPLQDADLALQALFQLGIQLVGVDLLHRHGRACDAVLALPDDRETAPPKLGPQDPIADHLAS